ncbi:PQQ-dependent sugar dehydrogenase [Congregibacter litoralis]|uniref:Glucose/sorbosone dehydrogenase n=1 Tax=Congregibacter litoralis KT71 TaxID=314285 RepID=A4AA22_9GAMM|nr:PQQ-dependent sugar dehydrogenase [Congregibacter litoralis]EAQ97339.1 Glucose/sorbosone dehydrogenase [Congregibacter litoralis KT71]
MKLMLNSALALFALMFLAPAQAELPFTVTEVSQFDEPWSVAEMPDGRLLVTETKGNLIIVDTDGKQSRPVSGVPDVNYGGQGGLGDVVLHPDFAENGMVYLSYAEAGVAGTRGAAVARGVLDASGRRPALKDVEVIWRQYPKLLGFGHYSHRMLFDDEGYLWISSGDRQKFTTSQDMQSNSGKLLRLHDDGSVPEDNPFVDYYSENPRVGRGGVYPQIWSLGHRNLLGLALDLEGRLWEIEMGPAGGDELNLIERGANYGYPEVSNGDHYDGRKMPDHDTWPEFNEPALWWTPVISPGDMLIYRGKAFDAWRGDAIIAGLSSRAIIRVELGDDGSAEEVERFDMGARIRSVQESADGSIWVLEDDYGDSKGRLLRLTP